MILREKRRQKNPLRDRINPLWIRGFPHKNQADEEEDQTGGHEHDGEAVEIRDPAEKSGSCAHSDIEKGQIEAQGKTFVGLAENVDHVSAQGRKNEPLAESADESDQSKHPEVSCVGD